MVRGRPAFVPPRWTNALLTGTVARRFYLEDRSKIEIAEELGISRFRVARLLAEAVESGLVQISIGSVDDVDVDTSVRLRDRYGLRHALVSVESHPDPVARSQQLGVIAAQWLEEELVPGDVLGLPWSRGIVAMVSALESLPAVEVVQLCGAHTGESADVSTVEVVVEASRLAGTRGKVFFSPLIVDDASAAAALRRQPQIRAALDAAGTVTKGVFGIGAWGPGSSTIYDGCTAQDQTEVTASGAVGEIAGLFFDHEGRIVQPAVTERVITLSKDDLLAIPDRTAVVAGAARRAAVHAALIGGLLHGVIVDAELGQALLDHS